MTITFQEIDSQIERARANGDQAQVDDLEIYKDHMILDAREYAEAQLEALNDFTGSVRHG